MTKLIVNSTDFPYIPAPGFIIATQYKQESSSGIVVPDEQKEKENGGVVAAVGDPWTEYHTDGHTITVKPNVQVGNKIIFKPGVTRYAVGRNFIFFLRFHYSPDKSDIVATFK